MIDGWRCEKEWGVPQGRFLGPILLKLYELYEVRPFSLNSVEEPFKEQKLQKSLSFFLVLVRQELNQNQEEDEINLNNPNKFLRKVQL